MNIDLGLVPEFLVVHTDERTGSKIAYIVNLN
jgi:hypothetical protein